MDYDARVKNEKEGENKLPKKCADKMLTAAERYFQHSVCWGIKTYMRTFKLQGFHQD